MDSHASTWQNSPSHNPEVRFKSSKVVHYGDRLMVTGTLSELGVDTWANATGILGDTLNIRLKMVGVEDNDAQAHIENKTPSKL